jgi:Lrp/AsnC family leucine-responsive transcriptional regulator
MRKKPALTSRSAKLTVSADTTAGLDSFDLGILAALKENARMPNVQIADRIGLSEAPCSRRIRRLEQEGVIRKYTVELEPAAIGVSFVGYVTLVLDYVTGSTAQEFVDAIAEIPEVMSCHIVSGAYDAILHVAAKDSGSYSDIVFDKLRRIPGVKDVRSSFVMRTIKAPTGLPLLPEA